MNNKTIFVDVVVVHELFKPWGGQKGGKKRNLSVKHILNRQKHHFEFEQHIFQFLERKLKENLITYENIVCIYIYINKHR